MSKAGKRLIVAARKMRAQVQGNAEPAHEPAPRGSEAPDDLKALLKKALARYDAMTPDERAEADKAQRESWARANISTGDPWFD